MKPFFITGANVKILVNGKTMAFCTDFSCSVDILTQTPKVLGKYEGSSVEPLGYTVSGTFTLIRYAKHAVSAVGGKTPSGAVESGNGSGNWRDTLNLPGAATDLALSPADLENATTFDIELYQKVEGDQLGVVKIRNARINRADFSVSKKSPGIQRFSFVALYADEDSFRADFSGATTGFIGF